ncbi:MAG: NUDIX hydrolase [Bacteroidota bacterium]
MNWTKISTKLMYKGWRSIWQTTFRLPNQQEATFDIVGTADYVSIAAFTKNKEAILVKQYRPGPEMPLVSFPEGGIEKGEAATVAAARELLEETGYRSQNLVYLKTFRSAYFTERQICVLALDCEKVSGQQLDNTEFIDVFLLPIEKFRAFLTNSEDSTFTNVDVAYLALDYMGLL